MTSAPVQDSGAVAPAAAAVARRPALPSLTSLRALAAAGVFLSHSVFFVGRTDLTGPLFDGGAIGGVSFFFVLSGTILAYNYSGDFSVPRFYRKRFARIYPVYLLAFAFGAFIVAAQDRSLAFASPELVAKNVFMVQGWFHDGESVPATAWTLSCEMFFYLSFPLIVFALRKLPLRWVAPTGVAMLAFATVSAGIVAASVPGDGFFLSPLGRVPEFAVGVLLGLHLPRLIGDESSLVRRRSTALLCACGVAVVIAPFVLTEYPSLREHLNVYVPICLLAIVAAAAGDVAGPHWISDRRLVFAGLWSYAFYSVHESIILGISGVLTDPPGLAIGIPLAVATFVATGLLARLIFGHWEEPWRERIGRSRPKEVAAATGK